RGAMPVSIGVTLREMAERGTAGLIAENGPAVGRFGWRPGEDPGQHGVEQRWGRLKVAAKPGEHVARMHEPFGTGHGDEPGGVGHPGGVEAARIRRGGSGDFSENLGGDHADIQQLRQALIGSAVAGWWKPDGGPAGEVDGGEEHHVGEAIQGSPARLIQVTGRNRSIITECWDERITAVS
ncbi:MAG TPA: hypothetical protein VGR16_01005, partial [Thermomicrobiales bacterium]|nr:hypothetical protein [Thermomicrobiales bacterium]